jgi:hypothetical protein
MTDLPDDVAREIYEPSKTHCYHCIASKQRRGSSPSDRSSCPSRIPRVSATLAASSIAFANENAWLRGPASACRSQS